MTEENQVVEEQVNDNPLEDIFPDRHPLDSMGDVEPEPAPEPPAEEEVVEPKGVEEAEPPAAPAIEEPKANETEGVLKALMAEREKRQALEAQLAQTQNQEQPPGFDWDNPEQTIASVEQRFEQKMQMNLLNLSEAQAQNRHDDYDQKFQVFKEMSKENPALVQAMLQQPDPAEFAYQTATKRLFTDEVGSNPQEYEDKLRAKIRLEVEEEFKQKANSRQELSNSLPPSAKSMTNKTQPVDVINDDPLGDLFNDHPS